MDPPYFTDIVAEDYIYWQVNSVVLLMAPPGRGKTTFINKTLLPYVLGQEKEILYLSNRVALHKELIHQMCDQQNIPYDFMEDEKFAQFPGITFVTYQTLQEMLSSNIEERSIPFYDYIVMDEIHYVHMDSAFNPKISRFLKWFQNRSCSVTIAISATMEPVLGGLGYYDGDWCLVDESNNRQVYERPSKEIVSRLRHMNDQLWVYKLEEPLPKMNIYVYDDVDELVDIINEDSSQDRWLIFMSNKESADVRISKKISHKNAVIAADDKESDVMKKIVMENCYEEKVLVTTKVLDNGVSLHDESIRHIVIDTTSRVEFIQMLGRRRIHPNESLRLNLYIPKKNQAYFQNLLKYQVNSDLEFIKLPVQNILQSVFADRVIYEKCVKYFDYRDGGLVLNPMAIDYLENKRRFLEEMIFKIQEDPDAFVKAQLSWIDKKNEFKSIISLHEQKVSCIRSQVVKLLEERIESSLDKMQQKNLCEEMKDKLHYLLPQRFPHKNRMPGLLQVNSALELLEIPFEILSIPGKRKGEQTIWQVQRIIEPQ